MSAGAKLSSTSNNDIQMVYPDTVAVIFDRRIKTRDDWVSGVDIVPIPGQKAEEERALVAAQDKW